MAVNVIEGKSKHLQDPMSSWLVYNPPSLYNSCPENENVKNSLITSHPIKPLAPRRPMSGAVRQYSLLNQVMGLLPQQNDEKCVSHKEFKELRVTVCWDLHRLSGCPFKIVW